jgi:hypothetical protein
LLQIHVGYPGDPVKLGLGLKLELQAQLKGLFVAGLNVDPKPQEQIGFP